MPHEICFESFGTLAHECGFLIKLLPSSTQKRLEVIREQRSKYKQLADAVSSQLSRLGDGQFKKSGFLKIAELQEILKPAIEQAAAFIEQQAQAHPDLLKHDPYLEALAGIVGESIGSELADAYLDPVSIIGVARMLTRPPRGG
jgi:hypothetical protein